MKEEQAKAEKSGDSAKQKSSKTISEMEPQKIKDWFGKEVLSKNKEPLGKLVNAYIDEYGKVTYMIVEPENAKELRPIPTGLVHRTPEKNKLVAEIEKKTFEGAPSFKKSDRPDLGQAKWEERVRGYDKEDKSQASE